MLMHAYACIQLKKVPIFTIAICCLLSYQSKMNRKLLKFALCELSNYLESVHFIKCMSCFHEIIEWFGRDLKDHLLPIPLS